MEDFGLQIEPDTVTFKPVQLRSVIKGLGVSLVLFVVTAIVATIVFKTYRTSFAGWIVVEILLVFSVAVFFSNYLAFLCGEEWVRLSFQGVSLQTLLKQKRWEYRWEEIQNISVTYLAQNAKVPRVTLTVCRDGITSRKHFPPYPNHPTVEETVGILMDWKARYDVPFHDREIVYATALPAFPPITKILPYIIKRWGCLLFIATVLLLGVIVLYSRAVLP